MMCAFHIRPLGVLEIPLVRAIFPNSVRRLMSFSASENFHRKYSISNVDTKNIFLKNKYLATTMTNKS